jgi:outer membrane protein OmpA-like peptidoglycan-associated protein
MRSPYPSILITLVFVHTASEAYAQGGYEETVPPPPVPAPLGEEDGEDEGEELDAAPPPESPQASTQVSLTPAAGDVDPGFKFHAIFAGAKAISGYQAREFGFGASGIGAIEWGPTPTWGVALETGIVYLAGTKREPPTGLAELDGGAGAHLAAGLRIRPMAKSKVAPHPGGLWLSGAAGVGFTARKLAPVFDVFLGYDFLLDESMSAGPTVGYMQVVQTDKSGPRTDSANMILLGVHGTFDFAEKAPKIVDRDGDGILDPEDKCPDHPEDRDGFQDEDGCPDPDNDEDGVLDGQDQCPLVPEDRDGFEDEDGCPEPDNDRDGVPDTSDQCPLDPEDQDGFEDEDGCPDVDNDKDGIPDVKDLCPNEPETWNGIADNDGCPDEESVRVVGDKIELDQKIHFWTNSDRIRAMSYPVLDKLARFLINHPEYIQVDIEGHADERGDEAFNVDLSKRRAASILEFLASRGVGRDRLKSEGYGASKPLVEGKTEHAWFMNRRVEFVVTRNRVIKVDPTTGEQVGPEPESAPVFGKDKEGASP